MMKRIYLIIIILVSFMFSSVNAQELSIDIETNESGSKLVYSDGSKKISFEEAKKKYDISDYDSTYKNGEKKYFYKGNQIGESEYNDGIDNQDANLRKEQYEEYGIRINNTEDAINKIKELFDKRTRGIYYFVYSKKDLANIDLEYIKSYVTENYFYDKSKNVFTYSEYGTFFYPRYDFTYTDSEFSISVNPVISMTEENKLNDFMQELKKEFIGKSDYEKIWIAYTYLSKTIGQNNCSENNYSFSFMSAYNALIDRESACIGKANAFSYIMDNVGIESYIVEDSSYKDGIFISEHTFNIVKLDNNYYIIDVMPDSYEGFLIGNKNKYVLSNGIKLSDVSYDNNKSNIEIEYKKYDKLIAKLKNEVKQEDSLNKKNEEIKDVDFVSYVILILVLLVITLIIVIFTRKK